MAAISFPPLFEFPGASFGTSSFPAINPSGAPPTIPISFLCDPTVTAARIVSPGGVLTGIPFNEVVFGGQAQPIELPLPLLPTPVGTTVRIAGNAYPMDYQTAGSNLIEATSDYGAALTVYESALATFLGSASYATYLSSTATYTTALETFNTATDTFNAAVDAFTAAYATLTQSSAYITWQAAGAPGSGDAYNTYIDSDAFSTYSAAADTYTTATDTWTTAAETFETAVNTATDDDGLGTVFFDAWTAYEYAYEVTYVDESVNALATALAAYVAAGSPGSGSAYNTYEAAVASSNAAAAMYNAAVATFASVLTTVTNGADEPAAATLIGTSDWATYATAWGVVGGAYTAYVYAYNPAQSALNWWSTYASAIQFFNRNPLAANPYSSLNPI